MIPMLQVMTKTTFTLEFQRKTEHYMNKKKIFPLSKPKLNITPTSSSGSTSAIEVQTNSIPLTHSSQIVPFYDRSFFKYKMYFQAFFHPIGD